jgi:hypothetical protein
MYKWGNVETVMVALDLGTQNLKSPDAHDGVMETALRFYVMIETPLGEFIVFVVSLHLFFFGLTTGQQP